MCSFSRPLAHTRCVQYHWRASTLVPPRNLADSSNVSESYLQFNALGDMYGMYAENKAHWLMDMLPRADGSQCTGKSHSSRELRGRTRARARTHTHAHAHVLRSSSNMDPSCLLLSARERTKTHWKSGLSSSFSSSPQPFCSRAESVRFHV